MLETLEFKVARMRDLMEQLQAAQGSPLHQAVVDFLSLKLDQAKDLMVRSPREQLEIYQGRAQAYSDLMVELTRPPLSRLGTVPIQGFKRPETKSE